MNAKQRSLILTVTVLILALTLGACGLARQAETAQVKPTIPGTPTGAVPMPQAGAELTILAGGSGVTILEYQGAGVRCIIASDGAGVDMVCQNSATVPVQATPTEQPKQQVPNGSSEA
jgi:hypothetical protein